jgi:hypothetical protein
MSSSCCISVTQAPKVERWGCGVRELRANPPKASFNPLPIVAFATETANSYPNPVEESYKVDQVFCNLVDQYSENRRHKFVSRSFERLPQFSSYQCNKERVPDMADMQLWKGGFDFLRRC